MAEEQQSGGYQCEFVGPVPEELVCKSCKLVARKPHITDCCGNKFCQACIDPVLKDKKPCPSCGEAEYFTVFIKGDKKKILALQVHCTMKQRGCGWVGQLEQLDAHLDPECQHVDVECPSKCDMKVQKRNLATHLKENCPKRDYMCPHCNYEATFEIVSDKHIPECLLYPVRCPNLCGVTCEREFIGDHMQICSLEEVECELSYAGCKERFLRQDQDEHMQRNVVKHMSLMAAATLRISQEFEKKLQEKDAEMKQELKKKEKAIKELKDETKELKKRNDELKAKLEEKTQELTRELQEKDETMKQDLQKKEEAIKALKDETTQELMKKEEAIAAVKGQTDKKFLTLLTTCLPTYSITMTNYTELKKKDTYWHSEMFYSHPGGYQYYIRVWTNGLGEGRGTHVSVGLYSAPGQFDDTLPWPAKATITLHLLNQHRDQDHWTVSKRIEWNKPTEDSFVGFFSNTFIPHAELGWNARKQTQYLKDDCLRFRIGKVELHV